MLSFDIVSEENSKHIVNKSAGPSQRWYILVGQARKGTQSHNHQKQKKAKTKTCDVLLLFQQNARNGHLSFCTACVPVSCSAMDCWARRDASREAEAGENHMDMVIDAVGQLVWYLDRMDGRSWPL
jgi:hypothetical protein